MWTELRIAVRALRRSKTFTISAIAGMAIAIAANAAMFSLVDGQWLRPPGVESGARLLRVFSTTAESAVGGWSYPEFEDLRLAAQTCEAVVAVGRRGTVVKYDGHLVEPLALLNVVSPDFFAALGIRATHGRMLTPSDEDASSGSPPVVLGHAFWRRRFGGDPGVVGRVIQIGRDGTVPATIVGVLPSTFRDLDAGADRDLWMPPATWRAVGGGDDFTPRHYRWFEVVAVRLPEHTTADVHAEIGAIAQRFARDYPSSTAVRGARVVSDRSYRLESGGATVWGLIGLALLLVVITVVNVTNLLLARGSTRQRDLAVRAALGASRWRLVRQVFFESTLVGAGGAMLGLLLATWLVRALAALIVAPPGVPSTLLFAIDQRVIAFTLTVAVITSALFALGPALSASRSGLAPLARSSRMTSAGGGTLARTLVVGQLAVALVLVSAAGVLTRSFLATQQQRHGMGRSTVVTAWITGVTVPAATLADAKARLAALPGVERVSVAIRAPLSLSGGGLAQPVDVPGVTAPETPPAVKYGGVDADYFETLGTRVLAGRTFSVADDTGEPVVVISRSFADRYFPSGAVGALIKPGGPQAEPRRVIGVVEDVVVNRIGEPAAPYLYHPFAKVRSGDTTFLIATTSSGAPSDTLIADTLAAVDRSLVPRQVVSMREYLRFASSTYQTTAAVGLLLGVVGLALTVLGVYGVVATRTLDRTREFGIRRAVGAEPWQILALVLHESGRIGLLGIVIGIPCALAATHALRSLLFGVGPWDAGAFFFAAATLAAAWLVATMLPALRAASVNPTVALKES